MEQKKKSNKLPKTALILSVLFVVGCSCLPDAPDVRPRQIIQRLGICNQYKLKFKDKITIHFDKEVPIGECLIDGHFIISDDEFALIQRTYREAKKCYDDTRRGRCKPGDVNNGD
jgi:hypothetical protein